MGGEVVFFRYDDGHFSSGLDVIEIEGGCHPELYCFSWGI